MKKIDELLTHIDTDHICIQTHCFPDPDAIACAYGMQELLGDSKPKNDVYRPSSILSNGAR